MTIIALVTIGGGLLSLHGIANTSNHKAGSTVKNKPVTRASYSSISSELAVTQILQQFRARNSQSTVQIEDAHLKTPFYQRIPAEQASELCPDASIVMNQEPASQPGIKYDEPETILKNHDSVLLAPSDPAARIRSGWGEYLVMFRYVAGVLQAEGAPYPTAPPPRIEATVESGPEQTVEAGPSAYSSNASGGVYASGSYVHSDQVVASSVSQYSLASMCDNKTEERLLDPFRDVPVPYEENKLHTRACKAGNDAAAPYIRLAHSAQTSRLRGFYAQKAAWKYHWAYVAVYHNHKHRYL